MTEDFDSSASGRITRLAVIAQMYRESLAHNVPSSSSGAALLDLLRRVDEIEAEAKALIEADPAPFDYAVVRMAPGEGA